MGNMLYAHPKDAKETVCGRLLEDKEELEEGDVSPDPNTKKWEKIPAVHIGARLPPDHTTMFVRPAKQPVSWWKRLMKWFTDDGTPDAEVTPERLAQLGELSGPNPHGGWD